MTKLSKSVLKKIEKEQVKPLPKTYFVFRNILWWVAFLASIVLGAGGFAVVLFSVMHQRLDFVDLFALRDFHFWLAMLPLFWIIFFGLFVWISFWGIAHTKKAYRVPRFLLISVNVLLTLGLGGIFYSTHFVEDFEHAFVRHIPLKSVREAREERWEKMVDHGMLAGEITAYEEDEIIVVRFKGEDEWVVDISETQIHPDAEIEVGEKVGMRGEKTGEHTFKAHKLRPWDGERRPPRRPGRVGRGGDRELGRGRGVPPELRNQIPEGERLPRESFEE